MDDDAAAVIAAAEQHARTCVLCRAATADRLPGLRLRRALRRRDCDGTLTLVMSGHQGMLSRRTDGLTALLESPGGYCDCEC